MAGPARPGLSLAALLLFLGGTIAGLLGNAGEDGGPAQVKEKAPAKPSPPFVAWGRLGREIPGTGGFHEFIRHERDDRGRLRTTKKLVRIGAQAALFADRLVRIRELERGAPAAVLGHPTEHLVRKKLGSDPNQEWVGKDYQIQDTHAVLVGKPLEVKKSLKLPKAPGVRWRLGTLAADGERGLWMRYEDNDYRVTLNRRAPVVLRGKAPRKRLRPGAYIHLVARPSAAVPPGEKLSGKDHPRFEATRVIILVPRLLKTFYPLMF